MRSADRVLIRSAHVITGVDRLATARPTAIEECTVRSSAMPLSRCIVMASSVTRIDEIAYAAGNCKHNTKTREGRFDAPLRFDALHKKSPLSFVSLRPSAYLCGSALKCR